MQPDGAIEREKELLPFGWGRFGKSLERLSEVTDSEERLLASCVGLNPSFEHRSIGVAGTLREMGESTNVVLAATDRRLLILSTGMGGAPREHAELSYEGMTVERTGKRELKLTWPDGAMQVKGLAKSMLPSFEQALTERLAA